MSIIHDALKKVQGPPDIGLPGEAPPGPDKCRTSRKGSSILTVAAVTVGVLALGVLVWRVGLLSKGVDTQRGIPVSGTVSSAMTTPPAAKETVPRPTTTIDPAEQLATDALRHFRTGDISTAEEEYRQVLALPVGNRAEIANNLAVVLRKEGKLKYSLSL